MEQHSQQHGQRPHDQIAIPAIARSTQEQSPDSSSPPELDRPAAKPPFIYIESLADYNNGDSHGAWIDATRAPDDIRRKIQELLADSPALQAQGETCGDWAVHDQEGFGAIRLDEHEDLEYIHTVALAVAEYGDAFAAWIDINGLPEPRETDSLIQHFRDAYLGQLANLGDYGEQLWEEMGWQSLVDSVLPPDVARHTTLSGRSLANDLWLEGAIQIAHMSGGQIWVFRGQ